MTVAMDYLTCTQLTWKFSIPLSAMPEEDLENDAALCTGEDTCLRHFRYKASVGRCHKCVLLANTHQ
jgi:hypothetical protein